MPSTLLLLTLASGVAVGTGASVRTETRGGLIPSGGAVQSDPSLDFELTPAGSLSLSTGTSAFTVNYSIRMLRRFFVPNIDGFIILHQGAVGYSDTFGRGWRLVSTVSANIGNVDYAASNQFVGQTNVTNPNQMPGQNTTQQTTNTGLQPNNAVVPLLTLNGDVGLRGTVGRNHSIGFNLRGNLQRPLSQDVTNGSGGQVNGATLFQEQLTAGMAVSYGYSLSANVGLTLAGGVDFSRSDGNLPGTTQQNTMGQQVYQSGSVRGGATYKFSQKVSGAASAGLLVSEGTTGLLLAPVGSMSLSAAWIDTRALKMNTSFSGSIDGQPNTITGTFEPRVSAVLLFGLGFGSDWTVGIAGEFATPLPIDRVNASSNPIVGANDPLAAQTAIGGAIPVQYRVSDAVSLGFGVRANISASRLDADMIRFVSPSYTGYVSLSASTSSGP